MRKKIRTNDEEYPEDKIEELLAETSNTQWHKTDNVYFPAMPTIDALPPGFYSAFMVYGAIKYQKQEISTEGIFPTGSANATEIMDDFDKFWASEARFRKYEVPYRRGILLSGPPGSGKTCIIKLLADKMVNEQHGVVLDLHNNTGIVEVAINSIHEIHPDMPIMVVMEDIDHYYHNASNALLNAMDGTCIIDKVLFIATTNSVHKLGDALINRPGRFDTHYQIKPANTKVREDFIRTLLPNDDLEKIPVGQWARDTKDLPFGHIKELVVSVMVFEKDYKKTLERLRHLKEGQQECELEDEDCACGEDCPCEEDDWPDKPGFN